MPSSIKAVSQFLLRERARFMPILRLGKTGLQVTGFGLGGQALLEIPDRQKEASDLINKALDLGVTYFDTATMYGPSREYYGKALGSRRNGIVLASKVRSRDYKGAKKELDESFGLLKTSYIDIIQLHTIENEKDKAVFKKDGAIKLLEEARKSGKIGFIGITGHYDPVILIDFMDEYNFDTMLIAINPAIPFYDVAVKKAYSKDMGVIAMKVMSRGILPMTYPSDKLLHYAMARSDVVIVGCSTETDVERNVLAAADYEENMDTEIEIPENARPQIAFFSKKYEVKGKKWPSTYQPDWPTIQYEK
jgi:predicted aldo/keto reductase-like oxidoreductase